MLKFWPIVSGTLLSYFLGLGYLGIGRCAKIAGREVLAAM